MVSTSVTLIHKKDKSRYYSGRLFFDHLEKTGGTAVRDWLLNNFGAGCVSPHFVGEYYDKIKEHGGMHSILTGHVGNPPLFKGIQK